MNIRKSKVLLMGIIVLSIALTISPNNTNNEFKYDKVIIQKKLSSIPPINNDITNENIHKLNIHSYLKTPIWDNMIEFSTKEIVNKEVNSLMQKKAEEERRKQEEERRKQEEERNNSAITFYLSFYTSLDGEIPYVEADTASCKAPVYGYVASNVYEFGTTIELEGMGVFTVEDRGGNDFDESNRLDVFIPRNPGESNYHYKNRVLEMGRVEVRGWIN